MDNKPDDDQIRRWVRKWGGPHGIKEHAKACKEKGCPSYYHCYLIPGDGHEFGSVPPPTCAQDIVRACGL